MHFADTLLIAVELIIVNLPPDKVKVLDHIFKVIIVDLIDSKLILLFLQVKFFLVLSHLLQGKEVFEVDEFGEFMLAFLFGLRWRI